MAQIDYGCTTRPSAIAPRRSFWQMLSLLRGTARSRRRLAELDAHQLQDIGLSARDAAEEAGRPFWDVPAHWLK